MSATLAARARTTATLAVPPRRASATKRGKRSLAARILSWLGRRPGRGLVVVLFLATAVAIVMNALLFQTARHPAPLLSAPSAPAAPAAPVTREVERRHEPAAVEPQASEPAPLQPLEPAVLPPARPGGLSRPQAQNAAPREAAPRPAAAIPARQVQPAAAPSRPAPARDPIADLINGTDFRPPAEIRGRAPGR